MTENEAWALYKRRRKRRLDARGEDGRWVTTENNHKVHINGEGEPDKGNKHVIEKMTDGGAKSASRSVKDFYPKNSYQNTDEFKKAAKIAGDSRRKEDETREKMRALEKEIEKESELRPFEYDVDKEPDRELTDEEWDALLQGRSKARYLTPKGEELKKQYKALQKIASEESDKEEEASERIKLIKQEESVKQMEEYIKSRGRDIAPEKAKSDNYEGFTLETTGTSYGDDFLKNGGYIAEMTPREYLERCAFEIFKNGTLESTLNGAIDENVQKYAQMMRDGTKFDLPYLDYKERGQEGRHRALAAYINGIEKIPVLIIGKPRTLAGLRLAYQSREETLEELREQRNKRLGGRKEIEIPDDLLLEDFELDSLEPLRVNFDCGKDYLRVKEARRMDADDDEGRWITTENGHRVHISEEGEPDKGNPYVIEAMEGKDSAGSVSFEKYGKTYAERCEKRMALTKACQEGLRGYRSVLKAKREILEAKRSYVRDFDKLQKELSVLENVTKENLEAKKREFDRLIEEADRKEFEAEEATYDWTSKKDKRRLENDYEVAKEKAIEARRNRRLLNDFEFNKNRLESVKENRKSYDLEYEQAVKEYEDAKAHMEGIVDRYNRHIEEMDRAILAKYPDYDSIKSTDDVSEYLTAKGYFRVTKRDSRMLDTVAGEPRGGLTNFGGCDLSVAKSMCKLCDSLYDRFPEMKGKISGIYLNDSEDAGGSVRSLYGGISLNKEMFGQIDGFDDFYSGTLHPTIKGTSKNQKHAAVLSHEFGHMLDFYLADEKDNGIGDYVTYYDPETGWSREVFSVGPAILKKAAYNLGIAKTDLKKRLSVYSCKNDVEALAEAFSEFIASDEPRPEAKEVGRQIVALYSTGKLVGKEKKR